MASGRRTTRVRAKLATILMRLRLVELLENQGVWLVLTALKERVPEG